MTAIQQQVKEFERMEIEATLFAQSCRKARNLLLASVSTEAIPTGGKKKKLSEATVINLTNRRIQHLVNRGNKTKTK